MVVTFLCDNVLEKYQLFKHFFFFEFYCFYLNFIVNLNTTIYVQYTIILISCLLD